jgi:hypothetical protein
VTTGGTACAATVWESSSSVVCMVGGGVGGGGWRGEGLPIVVRVWLLTGFYNPWCYVAAKVSSVCDAHSPLSLQAADAMGKGVKAERARLCETPNAITS